MPAATAELFTVLLICSHLSVFPWHEKKLRSPTPPTNSSHKNDPKRGLCKEVMATNKQGIPLSAMAFEGLQRPKVQRARRVGDRRARNPGC